MSSDLITLNKEFYQVLAEFPSLSELDKIRTLSLAKKLGIDKSELPLRKLYFFAVIHAINDGIKSTPFPNGVLTREFSKFLNENINEYEINVLKFHISTMKGSFFLSSYSRNSLVLELSRIHPDIALLCLDKALEGFKSQNPQNYTNKYLVEDVVYTINEYCHFGIDLRQVITRIKQYPMVIKQFLETHPECQRYANMM